MDATVGAPKPRSAEGAPLRSLMLEHGALVYRFCLGFLGDADAAADARQAVFVQAHRDWGRRRDGASVRAWLLAIARHRCLDVRRGDRRRSAREQIGPVAAAMPDPGALLEQSEIVAVVRRCLDELPEHSREPVVLRFISELAYQEIAAVTGAKISTLQMRVGRAMHVLKDCIQRHGGTL